MNFFVCLIMILVKKEWDSEDKEIVIMKKNEDGEFVNH